MEFVVVLGILFVVVIVAFYAIQSGIVVQNPVPEGVYKEQEAVSESIKGVIRDAADNTLRTMMTHGGYLDSYIPGVTKTYEDVEHVDFLFMGVPFWQQCSRTRYPPIGKIEEWMGAAIEKIVLDGLDDIELTYGDRAEFERDEIEVSVDISGGTGIGTCPGPSIVYRPLASSLFSGYQHRLAWLRGRRNRCYYMFKMAYNPLQERAVVLCFRIGFDGANCLLGMSKGPP